MANSLLYTKFKDFRVENNNAGWDSFVAKSKTNPLGNKIGSYVVKGDINASWNSFASKGRRKAALVFWTIKVPLIALLLAIGFIGINKDSSKSPLYKDRISKTTRDENRTIKNEHTVTKEALEARETTPSTVKTANDAAHNATKSDKVNSVGNSNRESAEKYAVKTGNRNVRNKMKEKDETSNPTISLAEKEERRDFTKEKWNHNLAFMLLSPLDYESNLNIPALKQLNKEDVNTKHDYWSIMVSGGVLYSKINTESKPGKGAVVNKYFNENESKAGKYGLGYNVEVSALYKYFVQTSLKFGIGISQFKYKNNYSFIEDSVPVYDKITGQISYLPPNKDTLNSKGFVSNNNNKVVMLNIPLGIEKRVSLGRGWNGLLSLGANVSYVLQASGKRMDRIYITELNNLDKSAYKKWNVAYNIGIGIEKNINEQYTLGLMTNYQKNATTFGNDIYLKSNYNAIGVNFFTKIRL